MYIAGFVIPVPEDRYDDYVAWAKHSANLIRELGCLEVVEAWEDQVPEGRETDFRKAVAAQSDEKIVFTWQIWPDRATVDAAEKVMSDDPRFEAPENAPFSMRRLIFGSFTPLHVMGRE